MKVVSEKTFQKIINLDWRELSLEYEKLEAREASARAIMEKFVNKVDTGMARSKETYNEMKAWLEE